MKIDRLLGIIVYLLNHGTVNAKALSEVFEVSTRTIVRDMETLCMAGIPVTTLYGAGGGYKILENFKLSNQLFDREAYGYLVAAMEGLKSGYTNKKIKDVTEKVVLTAGGKEVNQNIFLNFSVMQEGYQIKDTMLFLEEAIRIRNTLEFDYTNAADRTSKKSIDPLALEYRWYAWYLLGYCHECRDYRWYKVIRMRNLMLSPIPFQGNHLPAGEIMKTLENKDTQKYYSLTLKCDMRYRVQFQEYLKGQIIKEEEDYFLMHLYGAERERMWFSLLLSFGKAIEVLEPIEVKDKLVRIAEEITYLYT